MATPECQTCGARMIPAINVDPDRERGGAKFCICPNVPNLERVRDALDYTHLEVYCAKPQAKTMEVNTLVSH